MNILYYISGHGFGHAVRQSEVMRAFHKRIPGLVTQVRCSNAHPVMHTLFSQAKSISHSPIDFEVKETECTLNLDYEKTILGLDQLFNEKQKLLEQETAFVKQSGADLLIADIPFLCGEVAERAQIPLFGIGNFTWDWIFEPALATHPTGKKLLSMMREGYSQFETYFKLPFSHEAPFFNSVVGTPLLTRISQLSKEDARPKVAISKEEKRPVVLIAVREAISLELFKDTLKKSQDFLFVSPDAYPFQADNLISNVRLDPKFRFTELLQSADIVLGKLGYGLVSESIAAQKKLLFPERLGFRETALLKQGVETFIPSLEISNSDFFSGAWADSLNTLHAKNAPYRTVDCNGAQFIVDTVLTKLQNPSLLPLKSRAAEPSTHSVNS